MRILLLTHSATAAQPLHEMERWRDTVAALPGVSAASFAFSEEGLPSLRDGLRALVDANDQPIVIVPMALPSEPSFENWLRRTIQRWQAADSRPWPEIRIAAFPGAQQQMQDVLAACLASNAPVEPGKQAGEGSIVPAQKRRVLVCMGGPCNAAGAAVIWGHLRNEQKRLSLRTTGDGMMSARTSCLGSCSLALGALFSFWSTHKFPTPRRAIPWEILRRNVKGPDSGACREVMMANGRRSRPGSSGFSRWPLPIIGVRRAIMQCRAHDDDRSVPAIALGAEMPMPSAFQLACPE